MAYALLSVFDKTGVTDLARSLSESGLELISTGQTHRVLTEEAGLSAAQVSDLTGFPEILGGRVKSLHPKIHGGILARRSDFGHVREMESHAITPVDVVVSNLYPFVKTISDPDVAVETALENIDIGGPAMIRAAAKNYPDVIVVVDPSDYETVAQLIAAGEVPQDLRRKLAAKAFQHVAAYDTAVAGYLRSELSGSERFPEELTASWQRVRALRYGENPHQQGAVYSDPGKARGVAGAQQLHGMEMGYINYLDADSAWRSVAGLSRNGVSIIKHANPCGLAVHDDQSEAYRRALAGDPVSAYGGIVGFNSPVEGLTAEAMKGVLFHVIIAPEYEAAALETLRRRKNVRILQVTDPGEGGLRFHSIAGGVLVQEPDPVSDDPEGWRVVSERAPSDAERRDLAFAMYACAMIKSNAIVVAKDRAIVGMGAGQPNRVTSVHLAGRTAGEASQGSVLASDAFFPFPDGITAAADAGCTAVIAPGGSIRDEEVIEEANNRGLALVFAPNRHFLH